MEAIRLHVEDGWSYRKISEHLDIQDKDRVKKWMRTYRECGIAGFKDKRGNPSRIETEQERELRRLQLEVDVLKKWLHILNREGYSGGTACIFGRKQETVGYRRMYRQYGHVVNHKKVLRLMRELGIQAIIHRKYAYRTSYEAAVSDGRVAENHGRRPKSKRVTDVTQYRVFDDRIYLSVVKDLWNGEIVAYHISRRNGNPLVLETFRKAFDGLISFVHKVSETGHSIA
ncbi:IS3 family transposase [Paenibacillus sp. TAB 01]|uniref:IS3 family transposase n=1 Tax=Paenibacillus sp. TAB 01 TaxID=3368988 RepID=UPI0037520F14